jgi:hypothetical protein
MIYNRKSFITLIPEFVEAKKNERTLKRIKIKHLKLNFSNIYGQKSTYRMKPGVNFSNIL